MPVDPLTTALAGAAWVWDKYGEAIAGRAAGAAKWQWDRRAWGGAAEAYRAKIRKLYGTMQITGMARPVPLDDIFTDAYMLDKPAAFSRFDIERLKQQSADPEAPRDAERFNGLRLVVERGNLFILGKPGAGKTTFLKYVAIKAAEQTIDKVPVFVSLKEWADSKEKLLPFINARFDTCGFPDAQPFVEELLRSGSAIVLFDGLDEVNQESGERDEQTRQINNFIEKYDRTQVLITCRIAASDYSFNPFTYVELADFTERQIETFVGNWFRNGEGGRDEETSRKFMEEFGRDDNKGLRDLARTPLLLTLLCLAFNETMTFPQRRVEIYKEALDALLKKWDSSRKIKRDEVYRKLSLGHKENLLARIAAETFERNEYFIPQGELARRITDFVKNVPPHDTDEALDGETILKSIEAQHGIFVERARGIYSFSHLTFQEYFTAKYIADNAARGTLARLVKNCTDFRWREVFLLTTSLLPDSGPFINIFRRGLDELIQDDEKLVALLAWGDKKPSSVKTDVWYVRASYLTKELYWQSRDPVTLAAIWSVDRTPAESPHDFDATIDTSLFYTLRLAAADANPAARGRGIGDHLAYRLATACNYALCEGLNELAGELAALAAPPVDATFAEWNDFTDKLIGLMAKHRDIAHRRDLTEEQELTLVNYFYATRLLMECLDLATMPPEEKRAVMESLFAPPGRTESKEVDAG